MFAPITTAAGPGPLYQQALFARSSREPALQIVGMRDAFVTGSYTSQGQSGIGNFSAVDTTVAYSNGEVVERYDVTQAPSTGTTGAPATQQQLLSSSSSTVQYGSVPPLDVSSLTAEIAAFIKSHPVDDGTAASVLPSLYA